MKTRAVPIASTSHTQEAPYILLRGEGGWETRKSKSRITVINETCKEVEQGRTKANKEVRGKEAKRKKYIYKNKEGENQRKIKLTDLIKRTKRRMAERKKRKIKRKRIENEAQQRQWLKRKLDKCILFDPVIVSLWYSHLAYWA